MYRIGNEITETVRYCRHLRDDVIQYVESKEQADSIVVNDKCYPLETEVEQIDLLQYISDMLNGVTENDIPET